MEDRKDCVFLARGETQLTPVRVDCESELLGQVDLTQALKMAGERRNGARGQEHTGDQHRDSLLARVVSQQTVRGCRPGAVHGAAGPSSGSAGAGFDGAGVRNYTAVLRRGWKAAPLRPLWGEGFSWWGSGNPEDTVHPAWVAPVRLRLKVTPARNRTDCAPGPGVEPLPSLKGLGSPGRSNGRRIRRAASEGRITPRGVARRFPPPKVAHSGAQPVLRQSSLSGWGALAVGSPLERRTHGRRRRELHERLRLPAASLSQTEHAVPVQAGRLADP